MTLIVADPRVKDEIIAARKATGRDRQDEVWEGVYILMPDPNIEHQAIAGRLQTILDTVIGLTDQGMVLPGCNVSDRLNDWTENYRCPDVVVILRDTSAENRGAYLYGGPDFAVEIISPRDRSREKLDFYAAVGTREILIVDRDPWQMELYRLVEGQLALVGTSTVESDTVLTSEMVPLSFRLTPGNDRPHIKIVHRDSEHQWTI